MARAYSSEVVERDYSFSSAQLQLADAKRHNKVLQFQRNALRDTSGNALSSDEAGAMIYNTDTNKLQVWNGSSWNDCF